MKQRLAICLALVSGYAIGAIPAITGREASSAGGADQSRKALLMQAAAGAEPATMLLMGASLVSIGIRGARRKKI